MTRDWERTFSSWAQRPSETEQTRCENALSAISNAISNSPKLSAREIKVFTQGSYRNRVNVRQNSDVDIGVMLHQYFLPQYPEGKTNADFGNYEADYDYPQFKNELEEALVAHLGQAAVKRGNKAFNIRETSYHVEADAVPFFEFRHYWDTGSYRAGVALYPDNNTRRIENYPERLIEYWPAPRLHYENGVAKNTSTSRRFKGMVRILKRLRIDMEDAGNGLAKQIPGYLLECLVWNAPNYCFNFATWTDRVQSVLRYLWQNTREAELCKDWCEVDDIKYLFHFLQPWSRQQGHDFINTAWDYVGVKAI